MCVSVKLPRGIVWGCCRRGKLCSGCGPWSSRRDFHAVYRILIVDQFGVALSRNTFDDQEAKSAVER